MHAYTHTHAHTYIHTHTHTYIHTYMDNRCSNNQAEQLAIAKALEALEKTDIEKNRPRTASIITDSKISLDSIKNVNNQAI